jgi:Tol biopolymer transport system component
VLPRLIAKEAVAMRLVRMMMACGVAGLMAGCAAGPGAVTRLAAAQRPGTTEARGATIAFAGSRGNGGSIYTMRPNGSGLRRLPLPRALGPMAPAWSPDGTRLAFAATDYRAHEDANLYVVGADGHGLRQLTRGLLGVSDVTWSPDGQWIAFAGWVRATPASFAVRVNGTGLHRILTGFSVQSITWGPAGRLAIASINKAWSVSLSGRHVRRITGPTPPPRALGLPVTVEGWHGRSVLIQNAPRYGELSVFPAAAGRARVIVNCPKRICETVAGIGMGAPRTHPRNIGGVAWSPGGKLIVFAVESPGGVAFYQVPVTGGRLTPVGVRNLGLRYISGLAWQPA